MSNHLRRLPALAEELLIEALTTAIMAVLPVPIPRAVVRAAVAYVLRRYGGLRPGVVPAILEHLAMPTDLAPAILEDLPWPVGEDEDDEAELVVECEETEDEIHVPLADGDYRCPDCRQDIVVVDGVAFHARATSCPDAEGDDFWIGPEVGVYTCPTCQADIELLESGKIVHD